MSLFASVPNELINTIFDIYVRIQGTYHAYKIPRWM